MKKKIFIPRNEDATERECPTCHKLIYNKKEGCPDVSCVANHRAALIKAAKKVLRNWTTNKLAESVRGLAETLRDIKKEGGKL